MRNFPLPRIDADDELRELLAPYCRIKKGEIWNDPGGKHKIGCLDAADSLDVAELLGKEKAVLAIHDPPYNFVAFEEREAGNFAEWSALWVKNSFESLQDNSSLYIWLGADQNNHLQPFPEFVTMMRGSGFSSKSFITMRNQRGYGTQKNWMAVRQELLFYVKGNPEFNIDAEYTDIPKILRGYYKVVNGKETENTERGKSEFIRAGNVWVDIQQVFYRMEENVSGCYAQKPLKAVSRIIKASSKEDDTVVDFFAHSGSTLLSCEILNRKCCTMDNDPVFCEISLRRLENFRDNKRTGWQNSNAFEKEIMSDGKIAGYLEKKYGNRVEPKIL